MHWILCGLIIFVFAAPSAVVGVPYALGTQGIFVGIILCLLYNVTVACGSLILLTLADKYSKIKELKDLGGIIMGKTGEFFTSLVQNGDLYATYYHFVHSLKTLFCCVSQQIFCCFCPKHFFLNLSNFDFEPV